MSSSETLAGIAHCAIIRLRVVTDVRGSLSFAEGMNDLPFAVARVFYMYDIPPGARRGAHGHRETSLVLFALAGKVDVALDDGRRTLVHTLSHPSEGLLIGPWVWHVLENFAPGTVCLALASGVYEEADYLRDYDDFRREVAERAA